VLGAAAGAVSAALARLRRPGVATVSANAAPGPAGDRPGGGS